MKILSHIFTTAKTKIQTVTRRITDNIRPKPELTQDMVELSPDAIAKRLMNEVREYGKQTGFETAKFINKNGEILKYDLTETPYGIIINGKSSFDLLLELENAHLIHNHNVDLPLSSTDLGSMVDNQLSKITATTPSGGVSTFEFADKMKYRIVGNTIIEPEVSHFTIIDDINEIVKAETELLKKLGIYDEDISMLEQIYRRTPKDVLKQVADFRNEQLHKLAEKYGSKYTYTE